MSAYAVAKRIQEALSSEFREHVCRPVGPTRSVFVIQLQRE